MVRLATIMQRQGIAPPTTPEEWDQYSKLKAERRASHMRNAVDLLERQKINFVLDGKMVKIDLGNGYRIKYWPEIGTWKYFTAPGGSSQCIGFGVRKLLIFIRERV